MGLISKGKKIQLVEEESKEDTEVKTEEESKE